MAGWPCAMPEVHGQVIFRVLRAVDAVRQAAGAAPRSRRSVHVEVVGVEEAWRRPLQLDALGATTAVAAREYTVPVFMLFAPRALPRPRATLEPD